MKKYDGFNCFFAKLGKIEDVENMDNCSKKMLDGGAHLKEET